MATNNIYSNLYFCSCALVTCLVIVLSTTIDAVEEKPGCPETDFISCVTRLRLRRVPFDKNMLNVVFNVTTEAKLKHTCIAYNDGLPCFRDRILRCGNDKQKRMLDEVVKMVRFLCSSTPKERQKTFLKHVQCIGQLLQMPVSATCVLESHRDYKKLVSCRHECNSKREFLCMLRVWVSEQSLCTLVDIEKSCGFEAAKFYEELQTNVFNEEFPIVCSSGNSSNATVSTASLEPANFSKTASSATTQTEHFRFIHTVPVDSQNAVTPLSTEFTATAILSNTSQHHLETTAANPWWLNPDYRPKGNVYNPGGATHEETTSTELITTTKSYPLWKKWLEYLLPVSGAPTQSPATVSATFALTTTPLAAAWRAHRRFVYHSETPTSFAVSTWRPWYLGGSADVHEQTKTQNRNNVDENAEEENEKIEPRDKAEHSEKLELKKKIENESAKEKPTEDLRHFDTLEANVRYPFFHPDSFGRPIKKELKTQSDVSSACTSKWNINLFTLSLLFAVTCGFVF